MWKLLSGVLIYALTVSQVFGQAALLPNAKQTFLGTTGAPLAGGSVTFYVPGSTNKKTTWLDSGEASNNTNPIVLDAAGRAVIYGQGVYRQVVKDASGNTIWDAPTTAYGSSSPSGATGTDTAPVGAILPWSSFTLPVNWAYANGQALSRTSFPDLLSAITIAGSAVSCTASSATLGGWTDTSQMRVGAPIEATCLPTGTTVASITNSSTITVSNNATATATGTATVFPWGNGDGVTTFNVPDLRGRVPAGSDTMQTTAAGRLTASTTISTTSGSPTATVASATGLFPGMIVVSANVVPGTTVSNISGTTITLSANATSTASGTAATFKAFTGADVAGGFGGASGTTLITSNLPPYTPAGGVALTLAAHVGVSSNLAGNPPSGGATQGAGTTPVVFDTATAAFTGTAQGGTSVPAGVIQPTVTFNYIIKVKSNTTGAGGVVSWGGLIGDIATDATLQGYISGTTNFAGIANAANQTFLANISGGTAQPTPTSWSAWMDSVCGSAQGNIVYRSGSAWSCLPPGTNGFVLSTTGAGSNPLWVSAPTVTPQSANTVYAGPTSGSATNPSFRALVAADLPGTFAGFANPSASVGLTAKNGTATTAMRSDGAPALDQSIAPTWTGQHTFSLVPIWPSQTAHFVWMAPTAGGAPAFRALVGSDLPNPGASSLGGVQSFASVSHQFLTQISTAGVVSATQPACADISNAGTVCTANTGTSGANIGLLNGNNTYSGTSTFSGTANFQSAFQIGGNAMTFPAAAATLTQTIASGASALGTAAIASAACATVVTATATGTATTDVVSASFNGDPTAVTGYIPSTSGMLTIFAYPTLNTVNFKVCNNTAGAITPGAITLNWRVVR